ncbi:MAG: response regulator transcription factor [Cyclobacteriaceae bacterium]|nr:response regulator transcription factor [Cyclobacteriaceae bacterium HetDA_MAG_MS6]
MNVLLIDDEETVRENLKTLIKGFLPGVEKVDEAEGVIEGLKRIKSNKPDLLFLDIEMKDGTGFDLLDLCGEIDFKIVFVTGHDGYAIKAFKFNAIDYLLKPIDPEELTQAYDKAKSLMDLEAQQVGLTQLDKIKAKKPLDNIVLRDAESIYLVALKSIVRCQAQGNYTVFYLDDGRKLTITKSLKEYEDLLPERTFFRPHQSHLINLLHFDHFEKKDGGIIFMKNGSQVPVSVRKKENLFKILDRK